MEPSHPSYRLRGTPPAGATTLLPPICGESYPAGPSVSRTKQSCTIFATYGAPSTYLDRYVENRWRSPELVDNWRRSGACDPEIQQLAEAHGLELRLSP